MDTPQAKFQYRLWYRIAKGNVTTAWWKRDFRSEEDRMAFVQLMGMSIVDQISTGTEVECPPEQLTV
jgi:hypothetical protein